MPALRRALLLLALLAPLGLVAAQQHPPVRPTPPTAERPPTPHPPRLSVGPAERQVEVSALDVRVVIHGLHAETTQTLTFFNPNGRVLEGELEFPLPDGATVSGFALDVDGQLVDASVVEKHQARVALEAEIRRGVDPGLVEQVRGNTYRTRIYPIPARGTRTVRLRWVSPLVTSGLEAAYHLPLAWPRPPQDVALRVEVVRSPVRPEVTGGFGHLELKGWEERWVAEARWKDAPPARDLLVRLPGLPARLVSVEAGPAGEAYFAVTDLVPAARPGAVQPPTRVAIAWDASASRTGAQTDRELAFLERLLAAWPATAVDLVVFRDRSEPPVAFPAGDRPALLAALRAAVVDGGTALGALDLSVSRRPSGEDALWLLFSDGLATLGDDLPRFGGLPVWAVTGATGADRPLLRQVASATGGELLDLVTLEPAAAVAALAGSGARLLGATVAGERGAADVLTVTGADRGRCTVVGRLTGDEAELSLAFGAGGQALERRTVKLRRSQSSAATDRPGPVATAWAQARLEALSAQPERNGSAILQLGRRFGLVTGATSLLVLETLEQHLTHDVEPAASRTELRAAWVARRQQATLARARAQEGWLEQVVTRWQRRVEWWRTERQVPAGWRWQEQGRAKAAGGEREDRARAGGALPAAAPPMREEAAVMRRTVAAAAAPGAQGAPREAALDGGGRPDQPDRPAGATIAVAPWDPRVPWLQPLRAAAPGAAYAAYLAQRAAHAGPAFYLDCAEFLLRAGQKELGLRVLSNLAELRLDDPALLRVMAWRLAQAGQLDLAAATFEKVLRLRPEEPQSRRDLALVLADRADALGRPEDASRAVDLLYDVAMRRWDRFEEIELVALMELNRILARAGWRGWTEVARSPRVDPRLRALLDLDLRVSLSWDADLTDVDLHLLEPTGEQAFYGHNATFMGGLVSRDMTQGYGPEEYVVRRAVPGRYAVKVHYYGSHQQRLVGPATLTATVFTNWGRPEERREVMTIRLAEPRDLDPIGEVVIAPR